MDLLLDALDQVSAWVDAIETTGAMPEGADGVSRTMTSALRGILPADYGAAAKAAASSAVAVLTDLAWLGALAEADRLAAFSGVLDGAAVLAVEYAPLDDCFFSGEDPFGLLRQMPGLLALSIDTSEPFQPLDQLDPYRCILRFRALTSAPRIEIEHQFRYVIEQVRLAEVAPHALVSVTGETNGGPVYEDFVDEAGALAAAADWDALRRSVDALLELTGPSLVLASALRWLRAVLAVPAPEAAWVTALIGCVARDEPHDGPLPPVPALSPRASSTPPVTEPAPGPKHAIGVVATRILDSQRVLLDIGRNSGDLPGRLASAGRTVTNLLIAAGRGDDADHWQVMLADARTQASPDPLIALLDGWLPADSPAFLPPPAAGDGPPRSRPDPSEHADAKPVSRILKVEQGKVDALMNLIGELVVSKNSLPFLAKRAEDVHGSREMAREIKDIYSVIDRLAQEMQGAIMAVRMLPVSEVFDRFPRLVRDAARKLGKRIVLVIEGEDTAADKNIIEVLGDPLLHIIRNSIDHGIELPEDREDSGKPAQATVLVRAFQESDQVVIEVTDDGRGIDPEKIKASAIAKGILDAERAARLSDQEAVNLVFYPGFSTAAKVSDLSGRGVGMDVVVTAVEKAGGTVTVTSRTGEGTTVRLSLPLSMAVTRVMMVEAGGGTLFGIPMDHIVETVRVARGSIKHIKQSEAFVLRESIVPLLRLDRILELEAPTWFGDGSEEDAVLVVRVGGNLVGLVVDHFREGMDIILKPFDGILASVQGYAGTALLGDGRVLLVLNLKELL